MCSSRYALFRWCKSYARCICFHSYIERGGEETLASKLKGNETLYKVAFKRANLLRMSLVTAAAMLAIGVLALVETTNAAEAVSLPKNGKIAFSSNRAEATNTTSTLSGQTARI